MYRNDALIPSLSLAGSFTLLVTGWLDGRYVGQLAGGPLPSLTVGQTAMFASAMLLLVYGVSGLLSVWLDGRELRPGRSVPQPDTKVVAFMLAVTLVLAACAGFLVRIVLHVLKLGPVEDVVAGGVLGAVFFLVAVLLTLIKRFAMTQAVTTEDEDDEVPW